MPFGNLMITALLLVAVTHNGKCDETTTQQPEHVLNPSVTPLMVASEQGLFDIVVDLLKNPATKIEAQEDIYGMTALMIAAREGHLKIVNLLIEKGANVNTFSTAGWTALFYAVGRGHRHVAKTLIEKGCDVNRKANDGLTMLSIAAYNGDLKTVTFLLEKGADVNAADGNGYTALMNSVQSNNLQVPELLLDNGADINAKAVEAKDAWWSKHSALMFAAHLGEYDMVKLLLKRGASKEGCTHKWCDPEGEL